MMRAMKHREAIGNRDVKARRFRVVTSRIRVLHLLVNFESGGTERQAVELLKRLNPERFDVRLAVLRNQGPLYQEIQVMYPDVPEFPLTSFYNANFVRQAIRLRTLLQQENIQLIHAHDFYSDMLGVVAARLTGAKVIASQRNLQQSEWFAHKMGQRFINMVSHRMLVNSNAIRDHLVENWGTNPNKISVVRNGLRDFTELNTGQWQRPRHDELCWELGLDNRAKLIGCVANLRAGKGHDDLLMAATRIIQEFPMAHFVMIGDGDLHDELVAQTTSLGIADHVHWLGYRSDAAKLQTAFDVAVLASLAEGLPNSVMEAMVAGVPVVATEVGGVPELIAHEDTGYLVPASQPERLAERIIFTLKHPDESARVGLHGQQFVRDRFGMRRMVQEVEALYEEVLNSRYATRN